MTRIVNFLQVLFISICFTFYFIIPNLLRNLIISWGQIMTLVFHKKKKENRKLEDQEEEEDKDDDDDEKKKKWREMIKNVIKNQTSPINNLQVIIVCMNMFIYLAHLLPINCSSIKIDCCNNLESKTDPFLFVVLLKCEY